MGATTQNEIEMIHLLEKTVRYFCQSRELDADDTRRMIKKLSTSQLFCDLWPEIVETRRADLANELILRCGLKQS